MTDTGYLRRRRRGLMILALLAAVLTAGAWAEWRYLGPLPIRLGASPDAPAPLAVWPWPQAVQDMPNPGVTHWLDTSSPDGTTLDLFDFDFAANPRLRFEIYDQDEDDAQPFDNHVKFWAQGVAQAARHLNQSGHGPVLATCNGLFYDFNQSGPDGAASHVTPVVLNGQVHYAQIENHRWTFGVKYDAQGRPAFKAIHLPDVAALAREFDWAAGGAQCLVKDGQAQALPPRAVGNSAHPGFAYMKTSRVSLAWSRDSRHLFLLFVKEPDEESISDWAYAHHVPLEGGWSLPDETRFWQARGVWGAVNSDAGDVAQLVYRLPGGRYQMSEPRWSSASARRTLPGDLSGAPPGGSLMYWFVREMP